MKTVLAFPGSGEPSITLLAETEAEKAILAFLAENQTRRWRSSPAYPYRAGGISQITLIEAPGRSETLGARAEFD